MTVEFKQENKDYFQENGFLLYKNFFNKRGINSVIEFVENIDFNEVDKRYLDNEPGVETAVYQFLHEQDNCLGQLCNHKDILDYASFLMGEETYVWSSKINFKAPWHGRAEYWHNDYVYWKDRGYAKDTMLSAFTFLDPHSIENAALHVAPKSHKSEALEFEDFLDVNGLAKKLVPSKVMTKLNVNNPIVRLEADIGDVAFLHASTVHGSSHNIGSHSRKMLLTQINTLSNQPIDVFNRAKKFTLKRAEYEMLELKKKLERAKYKYDSQMKSETEIVASSPIPNKEKADD